MPPTRRSSTLQSSPRQFAPAPTSTPVLSLPQRTQKRRSRPMSTNKSKTKLIKCVGCKVTAPDSLFIAFYPKSPQDYKEKCFKCRRLDSVADYIKTHANKAGFLMLEAQLEHIRAQREAMVRWQTTVMQAYDIEITEDYLDEAMKTLTEHPALEEAKMYLGQHADTLGPLFTHKHHRKAPVSPPEHNHIQVGAHRHTPSALRYTGRPSSKAPPSRLTSPIPSHRIIRLRLPHPFPQAPPSHPTLTPSALRSTAHSLHRAAAALETAHTQLTFDQLQLSQINSMFRRPFETDTIQKWAELVAEGVAIEVGQKEFWKGMEKSELEAVNALVRMSWDRGVDWEDEGVEEDL